MTTNNQSEIKGEAAHNTHHFVGCFDFPAMPCANLTEPARGELTCGMYPLGKFCQAICDDKYGQPEAQASLYHCSQKKGIWQPSTNVFDCTSMLDFLDLYLQYGTCYHLVITNLIVYNNNIAINYL